MLPKKFRLTVVQFQQNKESYKKFSSSVLNLLVKKSNSLSRRFVIVVPKKLDKRSSYRNRTRRIIMETISPILPRIKGGFDLLLKTKTILQKNERREVQKEIVKLFKQAEIY